MTLSNEDRQKRDERINELVEEIGENTDAVDELVHEAKAEEASAINNEGLKAQIQYLVDSWGIEQVDKVLCDTLGLEKRREESLQHVVLDSRDQNIKCKRCGKTDLAPLPMQAIAFVEWCRDWAKSHRDCKETVCPEESAGGGASSSTGPSSSSTSS